MRKFLLSAIAAAMTLTASALEIDAGTAATLQKKISNTASTTFKQKYPIDKVMNLRRELAGKDVATIRHQAGRSESELVTDPQGSKSRYAMATDIYLSNLGTTTHVGGFGAEVIISADDGTFSSRAFTLNFFQQGYSVGDIKGDSIIFHSGQYIYNTKDDEKANMYAAYLAEGEEWPEIVDTFVLTKDEKGRYVSAPGYYFIVLTEEEAEGGINEATDIICFGTNYVFTPLPDDLAEDKMPVDADVFECRLLANSLADYGESVMKDITVGVSGDKVYIGGLSDYLPECYLVGEKTADNTITFKTHQYIGYYDEGDYPYIYEFSMVNPLYYDDESISFNEVESVTMTFTEERNILTLEEEAGIFNNAYGDLSSWNDVYWGMMIGDFNGPATPKEPVGLSCYVSSGTPYLTFEWDNISEEGMPMSADNLWCEVIINGEICEFSPEYYAGLTESTDRIYFNTTGVDGIYTGSWTTIYLNEFAGESGAVKSVGVKIGYRSGDEISYSELVYAGGYEPIEDKAFVPSSPSDVVYYRDYYNNIRFKLDGKDTEGNTIPPRLLAVEILLDGEPLVFKDSEYYINGGDGDDVTVIGLVEYAPNYSSSLVSSFDGVYVLSLWGHSEIPEFKTLAVRPVCTGGGALTYGESCEINLERAAIPANPCDVSYNSDMKELKFGAMPVDTDGNGLAPWNYGYEVYVNDALYTFKGELYDLESDITVIPYEGFEYNYDFYLYTEDVYDETDWSLINKKVVMSVNMDKEDVDINKIGVRAVYTDGNGNVTYSEVVNSDGTSGIDLVGKDNGNKIRWFNLQGIEVAQPKAGSVYLRQQGGRTTKVLVKDK